MNLPKTKRKKEKKPAKPTPTEEKKRALSKNNGTRLPEMVPKQKRKILNIRKSTKHWRTKMWEGIWNTKNKSSNMPKTRPKPNCGGKNVP